MAALKYFNKGVPPRSFQCACPEDQFKSNGGVSRAQKSFRSYATSSKLPKCDFVPGCYSGPGYEDILKIRSGHLAPCIKSHFKKPVLVHQGHMQWLFDHTGKRYLDMFGGIVTVSVGHCHPKVNAALTKQLGTLWHTTNIYMHPKIHEYAQALISKLPEELEVSCEEIPRAKHQREIVTGYGVGGADPMTFAAGSEANDLAAMMARLYTGNHSLIVLRNSYHGGVSSTMGMTAQSTWKFPLPQYELHYAKNPDVYRGTFGGKNCRDSPVQAQRDCDCTGEDCCAARFYADDVREILEYSVPKQGVAGFIAESIQGVGGTVQFPKDYLKRVYEMIRKKGGVCIADEVQTGFGRTGSHFWGFQNHDVIPDIVTMAKGIGNGFPLGAVVTTAEISKTLTKALHFNTFGGNPLASAVGLEVLKVIEGEGLQENSKEVGTSLLLKLKTLREKFEVVGDVRGKGLMIGIEFVADKKSKKPLNPQVFGEIWERCKDSGVLIGVGGYYGNVMRIKPPMCITKEDADFVVYALEEALRATTGTTVQTDSKP